MPAFLVPEINRVTGIKVYVLIAIFYRDISVNQQPPPSKRLKMAEDMLDMLGMALPTAADLPTPATSPDYEKSPHRDLSTNTSEDAPNKFAANEPEVNPEAHSKVNILNLYI